MKKIPFTGIRRVMEKASKLQAEGKSVIHFEVGQPDFDTPENIKEAAKAILGGGGGQPGLATAGGKNSAGLDEALRTMIDIATK